MEQKTWTFDLDGQTHVVRLDWTYWGGRRDVWVDGVQRHESVIPMRWRSSQAFDIGEHQGVVTTAPTKTISGRFRITLEIDGQPIEPEPGSSFWEGRAVPEVADSAALP